MLRQNTGFEYLGIVLKTFKPFVSETIYIEMNSNILYQDSRMIQRTLQLLHMGVAFTLASLSCFYFLFSSFFKLTCLNIVCLNVLSFVCLFDFLYLYAWCKALWVAEMCHINKFALLCLSVGASWNTIIMSLVPGKRNNGTRPPVESMCSMIDQVKHLWPARSGIIFIREGEHTKPKLKPQAGLFGTAHARA